MSIFTKTFAVAKPAAAASRSAPDDPFWMPKRLVKDLDAWLATVEVDDIAELHTFGRGIRQDYAAVRNGLDVPLT